MESNNLKPADDLALIADMPADLQRRLNCLENYCEKWNMTVNMDKSNIIVYKNGLQHIVHFSLLEKNTPRYL
jgi:hypothetical protein